MNVSRLCSKWGVERIGFLTLTFSDHVTCAKEAGSRFNSLRSHVLAHRYAESIAVLERMKSGRIHFHLLVVLPVDIRTGFDFEGAAKGVYSSANSALRAEWAFWRGRDGAARRYRFGRTELLPVKSNEAGLSKYVGKYIAKHVDNREMRDKGVRLVRYSRDAKPCGTAFMFVSPRSRLWRWQVGEFAKRNGCADLGALKEKFGKRWAHSQGDSIMALEPPPEVVLVKMVEGEAQTLTLWDVFVADRMHRAAVVAEAIGTTPAAVFVGLYHLKHVKSAGLEFTLPAFSGESVKHLPTEPMGYRTIVWKDGTVERI